MKNIHHNDEDSIIDYMIFVFVSPNRLLKVSSFPSSTVTPTSIDGDGHGFKACCETLNPLRL